jgi:hypothetical protein
VEGLRVVSDFDKAVRSSINRTQTHLDGKVEYYVDENNLLDGVRMGVRDGWVRNCTFLHVRRMGVSLRKSALFCTVRNCRYLEPVSIIGGGRRYSFNNDGTMCLVQDCHSEFSRHDYVQGARVTGPNVFLNSIGENAYAPSEPHHRWSAGTLFDNITLTGYGALAVMNRGNSGTGHGWAGGNIVIWNGNAPSIVVFDPPTSEQNFAIGYTGEPREAFPVGLLAWANTQAGLTDKPDAGRYNGHALMGNGHIEIPDRPAYPRSLFVRQLIERIGLERALENLGIAPDSPLVSGTPAD